jgi:ribosomal protein S18 acetylase RimI-like enzyme
MASYSSTTCSSEVGAPIGKPVHDPVVGTDQPSKNKTAGRPTDTADRKINLLRRSGLFGNDTRGATIERACTAQDLQDAYRLVHRVYLSTGFIHPEPAGMRVRIFETTSDTATFIAKKDGEIVGVLSIVGDSFDLGLPSDSAFKSELDALRNRGVRLCEVTNQAVADEFRKTAVPTELMRCAIAHAMNTGYDFGVAAVSPSHRGFYNLLGFQELGSERSYSQKLHDPVVALRIDLNEYRQPLDGMGSARDFINHIAGAGNPFIDKVSEWTRRAKVYFLNPELLETLFVRQRNFLAECTPQQLRILERRWGQEIFHVVAGSIGIHRKAKTGESSDRAIISVRSFDQYLVLPDFFPGASRLSSQTLNRFPRHARLRSGLRSASRAAVA